MDPKLRQQLNREIRNAARNINKNIGPELGRAAGRIGREVGKAAGTVGREFTNAYKQSRNPQPFNTVNPPPGQSPRPPVKPPRVNVNVTPPFVRPVVPVAPVVKVPTAPKPKKPKDKSSAKFWMSGLFMLMWVGFFPIDGIFGMAATVGLAIAGYHLGKKLSAFLDKKKAKREAAKLEAEREKLQKEAAAQAEKERIQRELERKKKSTGNPELDKIIYEGDDYIQKLRTLNDAIEHEGVSNCIDRMEAASRGIFEFVTERPAKIPEIKKFMNYYLPTTLKLLTSYEKLDRQAVKGENISATMFDIEGMMETIATAFEKQLDTLFGTEAMDIQADIEVFETILTQEGLKEDETTQTI